MYLPDTNIFIQAFKGSKKEKSFLEKAVKENQLYISPIVIAEFLAGPRETEKAKEKFYFLVNMFEVLPVDKEVARIAAGYRKESLKTKRVHLLDCFLAAQTKLKDLVLVTNNKSDFPMKDIKILAP